MKTIQCDFAVLPQRFPNRGRWGVKASTCDTGTSSSFHLKTSTPSNFRTRKHSANPLRNSSRQLLLSVPYFKATQPFEPLRIKCGGSKLTGAKLLSANGSAVKSATTSGFIMSVRFPPRLDLSGSSCVSRRLSMKIARGSERSNQNILEPQQASRTGFVLIPVLPSPMRGRRVL